MLYGQLSELDRFKVTRDYYEKLYKQYDDLINLKCKYECSNPPKFDWKEKNNDKLTSSSLKCYMKTSFEKIVELFGWPGYISDIVTNGLDKSMVEWCLTIPDKNITFSIYNYKDHLLYCGIDGESIIDVTDWHIGCRNDDIKECLDEILANENISINVLNGWK